MPESKFGITSGRRRETLPILQYQQQAKIAAEMSVAEHHHLMFVHSLLVSVCDVNLLSWHEDSFKGHSATTFLSRPFSFILSCYSFLCKVLLLVFVCPPAII